MGLELGEAAASGPKCQRFAAIVESGVLLKLVRACIDIYMSTYHTQTSTACACIDGERMVACSMGT